MLDLREMLKAGIHFGHKTSRWFPKMKPYIWGAKNKIHLIDVSKTAFLLERTGNFVQDLAAQGRSFLWVGTKKPAQGIIQKSAQSLSMPYVINRWIGGTLSNFDQVKKAMTRLLHLKDVLLKPTTHYTKKELAVIQKEIERLEKNIGGILDLQYPPAAVIVVDAKREQSAVKEASRLGIPVIAMVDTNTDPKGVNFIIPSNDDSPKSIRYVVEYLTKRVAAGKEAYKKASKESAPSTSKASEKKASEAPKEAKTTNKVTEKKVVEKKEPKKDSGTSKSATTKTSKSTTKKATTAKTTKDTAKK